MMNILNGGACSQYGGCAGVHDYAGRRGKLQRGAPLVCRGIPCTGSAVKNKGLATSVGDEGGFTRILPAMRKRSSTFTGSEKCGL